MKIKNRNRKVGKRAQRKKRKDHILALLRKRRKDKNNGLIAGKKNKNRDKEVDKKGLCCEKQSPFLCHSRNSMYAHHAWLCNETLCHDSSFFKCPHDLCFCLLCFVRSYKNNNGWPCA